MEKFKERQAINENASDINIYRIKMLNENASDINIYRIKMLKKKRKVKQENVRFKVGRMAIFFF
jgi:hypothetical protein